MTNHQVWTIDVRHDGLSKYRQIKGSDRHVVQQRADAQKAQWDYQWARRVELDQARETRMLFSMGRERLKAQALERTAEAQETLDQLRNALQRGLIGLQPPDWAGMTDQAQFQDPKPQPPEKVLDPPQPLSSETKYAPHSDLLSFFFATRRDKFILDAKKKFMADEEQWTKTIAANALISAERSATYSRSLIQWRAKLEAHEEAKAQQHGEIERRQEEAALGKADGILDALNTQLEAQTYPDAVNLNYDLDYNEETGSAVIEFGLPAPDDLHLIKEARFVTVKDEVIDKPLSEAEKTRVYDGFLYQVALLTIGTLFSADVSQKLRRVTFNGWVDYIVSSTGLDERSCILTVGCNREDFDKIALDRVDARECFKALKGVAASKLISLAAVAPLERARNADPRFIASKDVVKHLDNITNLAMIDWQDFEHLVRQVFESEFSTSGSEVKVTQASRDGGVDAIIYDPDPIKGGKIIVQAKRYVHTADVSSGT